MKQPQVQRVLHCAVCATWCVVYRLVDEYWVAVGDAVGLNQWTKRVTAAANRKSSSRCCDIAAAEWSVLDQDCAVGKWRKELATRAVAARFEVAAMEIGAIFWKFL
ncbi:hypothetical protein F0562_019562 [Nyssa sinensis]|uniref:Uncharacterized protein n=1 Tax=Nyssa sinensis TaxID=561372 RepID=A0A5J5BQ08_9ASTE|nr:hypothetical protein F0562_019562 [Nyssa sinensis]